MEEKLDIECMQNMQRSESFIALATKEKGDFLCLERKREKKGLITGKTQAKEPFLLVLRLFNLQTLRLEKFSPL